MKVIPILVLLLITFLFSEAQIPAFPGAQGGGANTIGGRGGKVYTVLNLNDSGVGSLREAIESKGSRTVIFAVSGNIALKSKLVISNDSITIAGQTAPGDGICLANYPLYIKANEVIIRYIRCRLGDTFKLEEDAATAMNVRNLIIDHCSFSWSIDECLSVYKSTNITIQWCIISQSLTQSFHSKGAHGFGGIWGGSNASFHHNLLACNSSRNPRFASDGYAPVDFRNNVVYNWGFKSTYGGGRNGKINFVNNYFKPGPATLIEKRNIFLDPAEDGSGAYFLSGNVMQGDETVSKNNWFGVTHNASYTKSDTAFSVKQILAESAVTAYKSVLDKAGCSLHRDTIDRSIINQVKGQEYSGGLNKDGIIDSQTEVGAWPILASLPAPLDTDGDGMPDEWEREQGLDWKKAEDGVWFARRSKYTNLERYLNQIVAGHEYYSYLKEVNPTVVSVQYPDSVISSFAKNLNPLGRILETEDYYVWCCAPIYGKDGKVHVFYSRWLKKWGMGGWISKCEIAHAVADRPEGPYCFNATVLAPRAGCFDATTCHNPHIQYLNGIYYLFYMGTSDGTVNTKRIGLATAESLDGPWKRMNQPLLLPGQEGAWDDCCTTNPAFLLEQNGAAKLYYKSWNKEEYDGGKGVVRGNRKYGLAIAKNIEGPYKRYSRNPVIDLSIYGDNKQVEDGYIYKDGNTYYMLMRDMGYFDQKVGLLFSSKDGLKWSSPKIAWYAAETYLEESAPPFNLSKYGRFERPQILFKDGKPAYLFNATQGGRYGTSSGFVFKIQ